VEVRVRKKKQPVIVENTMTRPHSRIAYAARASKAFASQPQEAVERTLEKLAEWRDERTSGFRYVITEAPDERAHQLVGESWPCQELEAFDEVWRDTLNDLAARELRVGRGAFGGWDDGDARLVRFAWCFARHLRPRRVLETGVARGLTTRALLEALERNGDGHLWSIDLAPFLEHDLRAETAAAVPRRLYDRWTLVRGSSRRVMPDLVAELGPIDLFVHDSMHTTRNVRFELEQVWPALSPGGVVLIDDVEKNAAMGQFLQAHSGTPSMICSSDDGTVLIGLLIKPDHGHDNGSAGA
jgi:Methyltransferase domain